MNKQFRIFLLKNALFPDGPGMEITLDAPNFDQAEDFARRIAKSVGYTIEQVSEI